MRRSAPKWAAGHPGEPPPAGLVRQYSLLGRHPAAAALLCPQKRLPHCLQVCGTGPMLTWRPGHPIPHGPQGASSRSDVRVQLMRPMARAPASDPRAARAESLGPCA